jgi:hypothetical protein
MNKTRLMAIVAITVFVAVIATACQTALGQSNPGQPATGAPTQSSLGQTDLIPETTEVKYVGRFSLNPSKGNAGTVVQATGSGLEPNSQLDIIWQGFQGSWQTNSAGEFHGRDFQDKLVPETTVTTDAAGGFEATFRVPEGFGFIHDVLVMKDDVVLNKAAFEVNMQASLSPSSGPVGTPINIDLNSVGWRPLENSWMVLYDNKFTGWISSVTTGGLAHAVIPAAGAPGKHIIQIVHGSATFPYLNMQQSPRPDRPSWTFEFNIIDGPAILPPPAQIQSLPVEKGYSPDRADAPAIWTDPASATIGTPVTLKGSGLPAGKSVELVWFTVKGSRVSGQGWAEEPTSLGTVNVDANGEIAFPFQVLDDLGGPHRIEAQINGQKVSETSFTIGPSAFALEPASGPAGTTITIHLKGVGWTETANIYTLVYDNAYIGYACGFNSQGDVIVYLPATGEPGWHFINLYPGIYKGEDMQMTNDFRVPQLTYQDHPGEELPAFHFAFQVTGGGG